MLRQSLEVEEAERQALAEEEELRLREGVVEAKERKEKKRRKVLGERSRRPTMAREWRMQRQIRRRSQDELMAKVDSESPLILAHDGRYAEKAPDVCYAEKASAGCYTERAPAGCYAEKVPNCNYVEQVSGKEKLKQMVRGEL